MFCGVDEAGKGAVLGPMVVAAAAVLDITQLDSIVIRDSKTLAPRKREVIFSQLVEACIYHVVSVSPGEIDAALPLTSMNLVVARAHAACVAALKPETAYLDACDVNASRYADTVLSFLQTPCEVVAEHHADETYTIVGAASIIAKVTRDRAIADLALEYGDIGSGYPSDKKTIRFLTEYIREHGAPPACARSSWKTVAALLEKESQSSLLDF
ncbi:MAG: Ribonuclease HII [Methanomicrobiales archaeon 53_19]|jgi:ribonuclease HII|uniref:ribonuclease HII n=1 Tax=Methanocalculus sp. TaxID=2004547 RepID=UPI0007480722|nr:ribonuclease HII [Methanocalculus sp.]KUK69384.1 MAG: Ribonuclease HII [Methanocalculus sp. 52_23]KUL04045.1 MAG: Ribonuclease HII [Methanomicrobiales archaeon 53_19]HIJ06789.1 ribonuclease HII [Methanocalculus sp.]